MRVLGVDLGERRIGLALSDPTATVAQPLSVIDMQRERRQPVEAVADAALAHGVAGIVIGLPRHMDGREGEGAQKARAMAEELRERLGVDVAMWDERLTTVAAHQALRAMGVSGRGRKDKVDKTAAALILQGYLDAERMRSARRPVDGED